MLHNYDDKLLVSCLLYWNGHFENVVF